MTWSRQERVLSTFSCSLCRFSVCLWTGMMEFSSCIKRLSNDDRMDTFKKSKHSFTLYFTELNYVTTYTWSQSDFGLIYKKQLKEHTHSFTLHWNKASHLTIPLVSWSLFSRLSRMKDSVSCSCTLNTLNTMRESLKSLLLEQSKCHNEHFKML